MIDIKDKIPSVYTAHSKYNFYARKLISAYVLESNHLPLNPFTNWDYFMDDMVDRKLTVRANNNLIYLSDELWQFGEISDGCYNEIKLAMMLNKKVRFFTVGKRIDDINELEIDNIIFEDDLKEKINIDEFITELKDYCDKKKGKTYERSKT